MLAAIRPKRAGGPRAAEYHRGIAGRLGRLTPLSASLLACLAPALLAGCGGSGGVSKPSATVAASAKPSAASTPASPTPAPTPSPSPEASYTVKSGDTLSSIASANKTTADAIIRANNLSDPDKLQVGQKLVIPSGQAEASSSAGGAASPAASGGTLPPPASKPPPP